jgi:hypothetical protein
LQQAELQLQLQLQQQQQQQNVEISLGLPGTADAWWQQPGEQQLQQQEDYMINLHLQLLAKGQAALDLLQPKGTGPQPAVGAPVQRSQSSSFSDLVLRELQLVEQQGAQLQQMQQMQGAGPITAHQQQQQSGWLPQSHPDTLAHLSLQLQQQHQALPTSPPQQPMAQLHQHQQQHRT